MNEIITAVNNALTTSIGNLPTLYMSNSTNSKPPLLTPWMRTTIIPSEPTPVTAGVDRQLQFTGLIQLDYFYPAGQGPTDSNGNIDRIISWFNSKDNRNMTQNGVNILIEWAWRGSDTQGNEWNNARIYIRYLTFA